MERRSDARAKEIETRLHQLVGSAWLEQQHQGEDHVQADARPPGDRQQTEPGDLGDQRQEVVRQDQAGRDQRGCQGEQAQEQQASLPRRFVELDG